jgi:hypothetical protein
MWRGLKGDKWTDRTPCFPWDIFLLGNVQALLRKNLKVGTNIVRFASDVMIALLETRMSVGGAGSRRK